jgi:SAM-dependent methyltransferase
MKSLLLVLSFCLFASYGEPQSYTAANSHCGPIAVFTPLPEVGKALKFADVGPSDTFYDLGSGDGVVVISAARDFHAKKAVGVEIKDFLVKSSQQSAKGTNAQFVQGDIFLADYSDATVLMINLGCPEDIHKSVERSCRIAPKARILLQSDGDYPPAKRKKMGGQWSVYQCEN